MLKLKHIKLVNFNNMLQIDPKNLNKIKGIVAIVAAIVMYFTPDDIDRVIEGILALFGVSTLIITEKK